MYNLQRVCIFIKNQQKAFSTGYLPFRPGLVYGDRGTENWQKNASKTRAKRQQRTSKNGLKFWRKMCVHTYRHICCKLRQCTFTRKRVILQLLQASLLKGNINFIQLLCKKGDFSQVSSSLDSDFTQRYTQVLRVTVFWFYENHNQKQLYLRGNVM